MSRPLGHATSMPNEPKLRKRRLSGAPVKGSEIDLATVARALKTSQAVLRELFAQGQLQRFLVPRDGKLVSTEHKLRQWQDRPPKRCHTARKPRGQEVLRAHFADCKGAAERWWLTALWNGSLLGGLAWETEVPRGELLKAFGEAVGLRGTRETLFEFLTRMLPEASLPREVRYLPRKIVDGAVRQSDELWVGLPDLATCRKHFAVACDCDIDWYVATPDPVAERARSELVKQSRAITERAQYENREAAYRVHSQAPVPVRDMFAEAKKRQAIIDELDRLEDLEKGKRTS